MRSGSNKKINAELLDSLDKEWAFKLAKKLEEGKYTKPWYFENFWVALMGLVTNKPELTFNYIHLANK